MPKKRGGYATFSSEIDPEEPKEEVAPVVGFGIFSFACFVWI